MGFENILLSAVALWHGAQFDEYCSLQWYYGTVGNTPPTLPRDYQRRPLAIARVE